MVASYLNRGVIKMKIRLAMIVMLLPLISTASEHLYSAKWTPAKRSGYATCNLYNDAGVMVNNGVAVSDDLCEDSDPAIYNLGCSQVGSVHCYGRTSTGLFINNGQPVLNKCGESSPPPTCL